MGQVVIEGTVTPSVYLGRGKRRTVEVTEFVRTLVRIGAVKVVEGSLKEPQFASGGLISAPPKDDSVLVALDSGHVVPSTVIEQMQAEEDGPLDPEHNQFPAASPADHAPGPDDAPPEPAAKPGRRGKRTDGQG